MDPQGPFPESSVMRKFFQSGLTSLPCGESPNSPGGRPSLRAVREEMVREGAGDLLVQTPSTEQETET